MVSGGEFSLDSRLEAGSTFVLNLRLCQVRLHHNAVFPWIMLIPHRVDMHEIIDLDAADRTVLMEEMILASQVMRTLFNPTKLNVASLGNVVPQLHVHIIARYDTDPAWPGPVWNSGAQEEHTAEEKTKQITLINGAFESLFKASAT